METSCPLEMVLQWHGFNASDLCLLQNFNVCDDVPPVNVDDGVETAFNETDVTAMHDLGI